MAVTDLDYGDAKSRREYKAQRKRYEERKKKKKKQKQESTVQRGLGKAASQGRDIDKYVEMLGGKK
jgi:hypothetical protein